MTYIERILVNRQPRKVACVPPRKYHKRFLSIPTAEKEPFPVSMSVVYAATISHFDIGLTLGSSSLAIRSGLAPYLLHSAQRGARVLVLCGGKFFKVHAVGRRDVLERHSYGSLEPKLQEQPRKKRKPTQRKVRGSSSASNARSDNRRATPAELHLPQTDVPT